MASLIITDNSNSASALSPIKQWRRSSPLGRGSFGHVSLAEDLDTGRYFAVKSPSSPALQAAIDAELSIMQGLSSDRILACYGSDAARNLFLEYMDGGSLADMVKNSGGCLPEEAVRYYTRGVVEGLAYLHGQGIVHCDIKGQNVLVGSGGRCVKIADFGAAKRAGDPACLKGTPLWMAPEVLLGVEQSSASDIWSLGITVCEMLLGYPLWRIDGSDSSSASIGALLFKIACCEDTPTLPEGISPEVTDFVSKCLNRDPKLRWTASQLLSHPFLCAATISGPYANIPSPRSAFDFPCSESDSDPEELELQFSATPCIATSHSSSASLSPIQIPQNCGWITVRRGHGDGNVEDSAFFAAKDEDLKVVKMANLDSLAFLLEARKNKIVG